MARNKRENKKKCESFFFTNFPDGFGQKQFWCILWRYGNVKEVFINKKRDKWGKRFGFVRFLNIQNPKSLKGELDKIHIGNKKLHVNIMKF